MNSSPEDVKAGNNEHLRAYSLSPTKARAADASSAPATLAEASRTALFSATHPEEYQRVVRVAPPSASGAETGVAASGLGKDFQLALFEATAKGSPKIKGRVELEKQADDVDIIQTGEDSFQVAYCHAHELHVLDVKNSVGTEPRRVFFTPQDHGTGAPKPVFRAIRYLTPNFLLALANIPGRKGAVLQAFRLPTKDGDQARLAASTRLPRNVAQATALAARNLTPPVGGGKVERAQFVIAAAGHDSSVAVFTLEHKSVEGLEVVFDLLPLTTLREVHPLQITGLSFSHFVPPGKGGEEHAQGLKLGSISMANTAVLHVIPLKKSGDSPQKAASGKTRWVVAAKSQRPSSKGLLSVLTLMVVLLAVAAQVLLEVTGRREPVMGVTRFWNPYGLQGHSTEHYTPFGTLRTPDNPFIQRVMGGVPIESGRSVIVERRGESEGGEGNGEGEGEGVRASVFDGVVEGGRPWAEMGDWERSVWRAMLMDEGYWGEEMGEGVFEGVVFGDVGETEEGVDEDGEHEHDGGEGEGHKSETEAKGQEKAAGKEQE